MAQNAEEDYEAARMEEVAIPMEEVAIPSVADWELLAEEGDAMQQGMKGRLKKFSMSSKLQK